jgi:3-oxoacyl-[acyl-carrier protein] reductase
MALALITGGSRGIGAATAVRLARDGHDIAVVYRSNAEAAERVAAEVRALGRAAGTFVAEMADAEAPSALVQRWGASSARSRS